MVVRCCAAKFRTDFRQSWEACRAAAGGGGENEEGKRGERINKLPSGGLGDSEWLGLQVGHQKAA